MRLAATLSIALVLGAPSCGGGSKTAASASEVAPGSTFALLSGQTGEARVRQTLALLPEGPRLEALLGRARAITGSGGRAQVAVLDRSGRHAVAFAQPADEKQFARRLDRSGIAHARVLGWTVFSRQRASVEAVRHAKHRLADAPWFRLPSGQARAQFVERGLTVSVVEHSDHVTARRVTPGGGADAPQPLAAWIPGDAVAAAAVHDGARVFAGLSVAAELQRGVGLRADDLARAAPGDAVLFALPGEPVPTVTLIAGGRRARAAARVVADLAQSAVPAVPVTLDGVPLSDVPLGPVDLYYGTFDGRTVVTDDPDVRLRSKVQALAPDGLPDATSQWAFLDVPRGLPALESLAALAGTRLSAAFVRKVAPLQSLLVYRTHTATHQTLVVETAG